MKKIPIILFFLLLYLPCLAANIYVDGGSIEAGATWDGVDGNTYTCGHGSGKGYSTVNAALLAQGSGDDIYIRGGEYDENSSSVNAYLVDSGNSGTSGNYSSLQSYPGEWAILDCSGSVAGVGIRSYQDTCPGNSVCLAYYRIERLEIKNASNVGIWCSTGPITVRFCYIHDNYAATGGDNPGGIHIVRPRDCVVEYNLFDSNGATESSTNNSQIIFYSDQAVTIPLCNTAHFLSDGICNAASCIKSNIVRYNKFLDASSRANHAISHKGGQVIHPRDKSSTFTSTYQDYGDKLHHNLILADDIKLQQDFAQTYNNIITNGIIEVGYRISFSIMYPTIYNNYCRGIYHGGAITNDAYWFWGADNTVMFQRGWEYNNIIDSGSYSTHGNSISFIFDQSNFTFFDAATVNDLTAHYFKNNYIYRPPNATLDVWNTHLTASGHEHQTLAAMEAAHGTWANNRRKATSETTDSLFLGTSGYSQYVMRGEHEIATGVTVADGGIGGNHPYLSGVTIPSYVGPTNPDSYSWVEQVNSFDVTYFTSQALRGDAAYDESWIEGSTESTPAPPTISNVTISNGRVQ